MSTPSRSRAALYLILACAAALAGCGDRRNPVGPDPDPPLPPAPSLSFSYSGAMTGSFSVQGDVPLAADGRPRHGTWAAALRVTGFPINVFAARARTAPVADVFVLALQNINAPGTYPLDVNCSRTSTNGCVAGLFAFGFDWNDGSVAPSPDYRLASGTVTITAMDGQRVRGTFQGNAARFPDGTALISITNGTFDVPVVQSLAIRESASSRWETPELVLPMQ